MSNKRNRNLKYGMTESRHSSFAQQIAVALSIAFILLIVFVGIADKIGKTNYYLKDARVCGASILERSVENGKYYVRVMVTDNKPVQSISTDLLWVEVKSDFYNQHTANSDIGILLGNYDVYKQKFIGAGQKFEKNTWGVEEIYDSLDIATQENPQKTYRSKAQVSKKKVTKNGDTYLVLAVEERTMTAKVSKAIHDATEVGKEIECEFESIGDLLKIKQVIG